METEYDRFLQFFKRIMKTSGQQILTDAEESLQCDLERTILSLSESYPGRTQLAARLEKIPEAARVIVLYIREADLSVYAADRLAREVGRRLGGETEEERTQRWAQETSEHKRRLEEDEKRRRDEDVIKRHREWQAQVARDDEARRTVKKDPSPEGSLRILLRTVLDLRAGGELPKTTSEQDQADAFGRELEESVNRSLDRGGYSQPSRDAQTMMADLIKRASGYGTTPRDIASDLIIEGWGEIIVRDILGTPPNGARSMIPRSFDAPLG